MRGARLAAVTTVVLLGGLARADGCCMVPRDYRGDVDQRSQRGLVVFHDGHEELFVRVRPHFHGEEGPAFLEWVVTVPSKPTGYAVVDGDPVQEVRALHHRLQDLADQQYAARTRFELPELSRESAVIRAEVAAPATSSAGIEVDAPVRVGPFEITGVRARGAEGLSELNAYLERRGFNPEDPGHMRWFVDRAFTFLCIHVTPPAGNATVGKALDLPALRIGFDTEQPYYPAKFSSRQGDFALSLAVVTSEPLAVSSLTAVRHRLAAEKPARDRDNLWTARRPPKAISDVFPRVDPKGSTEHWHINLLESRGFNPTVAGVPKISTWDDDVFFPMGDRADLPPGWYYGDYPINVGERFVREHGHALWTGLLVVGSGAWLIRRRRARRRA